MTEIQWLVEIMLNHKLPAPVKDRFIARIGEVESNLSKQSIPVRAPIIHPGMPIQAASTQRILDEMKEINVQIPINRPLVSAPKPDAIDKETGRAMVATGKGTFGPRKF